MKTPLSLIFILLTTITFGQNIKKSIDKNDFDAVREYINATDLIEDDVHLSELGVEINPMIYAVKKNQIESVKQFVKHKEKFEDFLTTVSISFITSIEVGNDKLITYLYEQSPNVNEVSHLCNDNTAIMNAVLYGNSKWYFKLKEKSELYLVNNNGNNLVHLSAYNYNNSILTDILSSGLDINLLNKDDKTPLHISAMVGAEQMFFKLIDAGAKYQSLANLYADAVLGGNVNILNYFKENNLDSSKFLWSEYSYKIENRKLQTYYPYELAVLSGNPQVFNSVVDLMMNDIQKDSTNQHIKLMYRLLDGIGDEYEYLSITFAVSMGYKDIFEKILKTSVAFNNRNYIVTYHNRFANYKYTQKANIYFTKFDYRSAKRRFGKDVITKLYKDLQIKF